MKISRLTHILKRTTTWLVSCTLPATIGLGCVKGGSVSSGSSSTSGSGTVSVLLVYPTSSGSSWSAITSGGRYYIKGLDLTITGTCSRGVDHVKVDEGSGAYPETASCDTNGNFSWAKTFTSAQEGDKTLTITGYDVSEAAISGATATTSVRIDNTAPASPVVTTPASTPYASNSNSSTFTVSGTCSADTVSLSFDGASGTTITPSGTSWTYDVTLIQGASTNYTFYAHDLAGNISSATTIVIQWAPQLQLKVTNIGAGGSQTDTGATGFTMESSILAFPGSASVSTVGSAFTLETGFNIITNSVRAN